MGSGIAVAIDSFDSLGASSCWIAVVVGTFSKGYFVVAKYFGFLFGLLSYFDAGWRAANVPNVNICRKLLDTPF